MGTTRWGGTPFPNYDDLDDPVGDLRRMAEHLDSRIVGKAVNRADRDSRFQLIPKDSLVVGPGVIWMKADPTENEWYTVWENTSSNTAATAWRGCQLVAGYRTPSWPVVARKIAGQIHLRGSLSRIDGAAIGPATGIGLFTVPADCRPRATVSLAIPISLVGSAVVPCARLDIDTAGVARYHNEAAGTPSLSFHVNYWID